MINLQKLNPLNGHNTNLVSTARECLACGVNFYHALDHHEQDFCLSCNADLISISKEDTIFKNDDNDN